MASASRSNCSYRQRSSLWSCAWLLALLLPALAVRADTTYQSPDDFVREAVQGSDAQPVLPKVFWLDKAAQEEISKILSHPYPQARLRYWRKGATSVWILEEIGKEYPITAGFVITGDQISRAQVLVYRETRGMEIHLPGFLKQFTGRHLDANKLDHKIDGIAGATLSVNAMVKMAQVALLLNQKTAE